LGVSFAPGWKVSRRNIDFNGTTFWNMDGYCSVDLDGDAAGAIVTSAFATQSGTNYIVAFLLSGNGGDGKGDPPAVKTMELRTGKQFTTFQWNTSNDTDVEHGKYAPETWQFTATGPFTILHFRSEDPKPSSRGAVVATISVTVAHGNR
ncbi:MAG TPA: hypothetical protein VN936_08500, partial [Candidatus Acidoferrum sp.]|nr:hypothetical protein [Candidatus Acidoferrum sp.]